MESDKVHAFESTSCEESESKADGRSASEKRDVYLPGLSRPLKDGERLVFDKSAYEMYHKFHTTYPCLSFEPLTINESSEIHALEFPFQCSLVAGTQAMKSRKNAIIVMRLKNLNRFSKRDVDESSSSEEDEESIENNSEVQEPCFNCVEIPHHGDINRIRTTYVHKTLLCATWNAIGKVHIWNLSPAVRAMEAMDGNGEVVTMKEKNVFTFAGHLAEGFAMDWSSLTPGNRHFHLIYLCPAA
uniref:CAF1C_H4-bd domain-containing protein n=1 Tax=Trichuris muris TaxID=70415 RepID=A0A5S6Q2U0_TRIMR